MTVRVLKLPQLLFFLSFALFILFTSNANAIQEPGFYEMEAGEIADGISKAEPVKSIHPELLANAGFNNNSRIRTVSWINSKYGSSLVDAGIDGTESRVPQSGAEQEDYFDMLPDMDSQEVISLAESQEKVAEELEGREDIRRSADLDEEAVWTVKFSSGGDTIAEVLIEDASGNVKEVRTGPQVAWSMARGYKGAFGRIINEPYIWLPLCFLFLLPFIDAKRPFRLLHLDLLVLLSFSVSHYFFNQGEIFRSVPLAYPPLVYIFIRLLLKGGLTFNRKGLLGGDGEARCSACHLNFSPKIMFAGLILILLFRIVLNIADSNVVDVGYSGVIGAQKIEEGVSPYGNMPSDNSNGDTYGPLNYLVYLPFEKMMPWSGEWDHLPAAHGAAIFFDLAAVAGMYAAGRRLGGKGREGRILGLALAYGWAAYPYTTFVLNTNVNDTIAAAFIIWGFVFLSAVPLAAVFLGFAIQIKFFPAILAPLWASFPRPFSGWGRRALFVIGLLAALAAPLPIIFLGDGNLSVFWERSIKWQAGRDSPFSIWGQHPDSLVAAQHAAQTILLALAFASYAWPLRKTMVQVAAATGALLVGFQLVQTHWFYLYIPWFFPFALITMITVIKREEHSFDAGHALPDDCQISGAAS